MKAILVVLGWVALMMAAVSAAAFVLIDSIDPAYGNFSDARQDIILWLILFVLCQIGARK